MQNGYNLTPPERRRFVRAVLVLSLVLLFGVLSHLFSASSAQVGAESAEWEGVIQSRLILFRLMVAVPGVIAGVFGSLLLFGVLDRSSLGVRLYHWAPEDGDHVKAAKKINAGLTLIALILGILVVLAGVLR